MKPTVPVADWYERIQASRRRRERYESKWQQYAKLTTVCYQAIADKNEDKMVTFPNGDQVKVGLVFRNIEQTRSLLEVPEVGVRVTAEDFTRELGREDSHRESVVEQALVRSLGRSSLLDGEEVSDQIKWDGMIAGHGVNYSGWRMEEREVEVGLVPVVQEGEDGFLDPVLDEDGLPVMETETAQEVWFEGVQDRRVSPLNFLFSADAETIPGSPWHGFEELVPLAEVQAEDDYDVPAGIQGTAFERKTLFGTEPFDDTFSRDSVKRIIVYDKSNRELIHFLEYVHAQQASQGQRDEVLLHVLRVVREPITFAHPDQSPFSFFIPIPANDEPFGVPQVEHIRNVALEADKLRTRQANLTRQLKLLLLYKKGRLDHDQLAEALKSPNAEPVGMDLQDGETWDDLIQEVKLGGVPKELAAMVAQAEQDIRDNTGIPETPFSGADTATESENQMAIGGARSQRKRRLYLKFLTEVARAHKDLWRTFGSDGQVISTYGVDGTPLHLVFGREAFEGDLKVEALAGGNATNVSPVRQKMTLELFDRLGGRFGPRFDLVLVRQALTMFDIRDLNALMAAAQEGVGLLPPGAPGILGAAGSQPAIRPADVTNGQTIRAAINAPSEG